MHYRGVFYTLSHPVDTGDVFDSGYEAAIRNVSFASNPYSGPKGTQWEDGYLLGLREQRSLMQQNIQML